MSDTLAFLTSHFDALQPLPVEIEGLPTLFYHPLTAEQMMKYAHAARSKNAAEQARAFAELLVESVKLEDGTVAFPLKKGGPNPVEVLLKRTPPRIFTALVNPLGDEAPTAQVEDAEKKSETPESPGASLSTSSPIGGSEASPP